MDDRSAGEIDGVNAGIFIADSVHETVRAPNHVGEGEINDEHPNRYEEQDGGKLHAFGYRTDDQRWCDDREHQLVHRKDVVRNPVGISPVWIGADIFKKTPTEISE